MSISPKILEPRLEIRDISAECEFEQVIELLQDAFGSTVHGNNLRSAVWSAQGAAASSTKVAVVEGRVAGVIVIGRRKVAFPPVAVEAATIGPVATHPDYQRRGIISKLMQHSLDGIKSAGTRIAYIQGIPNFYSRFGFYPYLAKSKVQIQVSDIPTTANGVLVPLQEKHVPFLKEIYNSVNRHTVCSARREDEVWRWLVGPATSSYYFFEPRVFLHTSGRVCGYVTFDPVNPLNFREVVVNSDPVSCDLALSLLRDYADNRGAKEFEIKLPFGAYLMTHLRSRFRGVFLQYTQADGGSLMKIWDLPGLLSELLPYLSERIHPQGFPDSRVTLSTMGERLTIQSRARKLAVGSGPETASIVIPEKFIPGLITGYYSFVEIAPFVVKNQEDTGDLLMRHLFPVCYPFVYQGDNY